MQSKAVDAEDPSPDAIVLVSSADEKRSQEDQLLAPPYPIFCSMRLLVVIVAFFGFFTTYVLRVCMAMAVVGMVNQTLAVPSDSLSANDTEEMELMNAEWNNSMFATTPNPMMDECASAGKKKSIYKVYPGEFDWSKQIQGHVLGSFYWGYMLGQIPGGWTAQRYGGKRVIAGAMAVAGIVTLLIPVAARLHYTALILLRVITGITQGSMFPSMQSIYSQWLPPDERSRLIGFAYAGNQVGSVAAIFISGLLTQYLSWSAIFYTWGTTTIIWVIFWFFLVHDSPRLHPHISEAEKNYIVSRLPNRSSAAAKRRLPWRSFLTSLPLWAILVTHTLASYGNTVFYANIPQFMVDTMKVDMKSNGLLSSLPFIGMALVTVASGQLCDLLRLKAHLNVAWCRKLFTCIGEIGPAIFVVIMVHLDCDQKLGTIICLIIAVSLTGCTFGGGYLVNIQDVAPAFSSLLFAIANMAAAVPGFVAPAVAGILTKNKLRSEWRLVFYLNAILWVIGALFFLFAASGDIQDWAKDEPDQKEETAKEKEEGPVAEKPLLATENGHNEKC